MTYFSNITTAAELKNLFRNLCQTMHPDKGGNAEEFKNMLNEYETACKKLGGWNTQEAENVAGLRRGSIVIFFGAGMNETRYICTSCRVNGTINYMFGGSHPRYVCTLVQLMSDERANGVYLEYETDPEEVEISAHQNADGVRPLSKKFGVGYYWDDIEGKTYTEEEIKHVEDLATIYEKKAAAKRAELQAKKDKEEEERRQAERVIIAQWAHVLEAIPEGAKDATRKAILKRNICKVFAHYFPGIKVSVKDSSKCWCEHSEIIWEDGPTLEDVEAVDVLRYFLAYGWVAPSVCEDYGHHTTRFTFTEWRDKFGAFSDDEIKYTRNLSESAAKEVAQVLDAYEYDPKDSEGRITRTTGSRLFTWAELKNIAKGLGFENNKKFDNMCMRRDEGNDDKGKSIMRVYRETLEDFAKGHYKKQREPQPETTTTTAEPANGGEVLAECDGVQLVSTDKGAQFVGNTYAHKNEIKSLGARWNRLGQCWTIKADKITAAVELVKSWGDKEIMSDYEIIETETGHALCIGSDVLNVGDMFKDKSSNIWRVSVVTNWATMKAHKSGAEVHACLIGEGWGSLNDDAAEFAERWKSGKYTRYTVSDTDSREAFVNSALAFVELCQMLEDLARTMSESARKHTEETQAKAAEAQQLREDIATMSAQLTAMGEQLRKMSARLAEIESENDTADTMSEAQTAA